MVLRASAIKESNDLPSPKTKGTYTWVPLRGFAVYPEKALRGEDLRVVVYLGVMEHLPPILLALA
jgi:hypothetical protein